MDRFTRTSVFFMVVSFSSGAAALVYETIWMHWFSVLFGNTAYASAATLSAFFTGLALGAAIFGRVASRIQRPLLVYVWLEVAVIAGALLVPYAIQMYDMIYPTLYSDIADNRYIFTIVKFVLAFALILPATVLLGGTLPMLATAFVRNPEKLGSQGGSLYAINTIGAAFGTALAALWLIEIAGVTLTYYTGFALSGLSAMLALYLHASKQAEPATHSIPSVHDARAPGDLLFIAFASGFGTLALEVLLIHAMSQIIDNTIYSFGVILVVVLLALATSAIVVASNFFRMNDRKLLTVALVIEAILLFTLPLFIIELSGNLANVHTGTLINGLLVATGIGGPVLFVGGLVLPLTFRMASGGAVGTRLGGLLAANTLGGVLGSVIAGFFMLDLFGLWPAIVIIGAGYALAALLTCQTSRHRLVSGAVLATVFLAILLSVANPWRLPVVALAVDEQLLASKETSQGVISVIERQAAGDRRIKINNNYTLSGSGARINVERAGHLPLLLHPQPESVLFIGSATGITAGAAVLHQVNKITLVEIIPRVQDYAAEYFTEFNNAVYSDPRTHTIVEDGRNHLRATREKYDVIVGDLFIPWHPGAGSLYSREHFKSVRKRLTDNGVFAQWLPIFQLREEELQIIAATFLDVFPNATVWRGNFSARMPRIAFIGNRGKALDRHSIEQQINILKGKTADRWVTDPTGFWMLYVGPLGSIDLAGAAINTDDKPVFEFVAGRSNFTERREFGATKWLDISSKIMQSGITSDTVFPERPKDAVLAGQLYVQADALYILDRKHGWKSQTAELRLLLRKLRKAVPDSLLTPPDPNVADILP